MKSRMTKWWLVVILCFICYALLGIAACIWLAENWDIVRLPLIILLALAMNAPVASAALVERHYKPKLKKLEDEAFMLSAGMCVHKDGIRGDDGGSPICPVTGNRNAYLEPAHSCCPKCTVPEEECPMMNNEL